MILNNYWNIKGFTAINSLTYGAVGFGGEDLGLVDVDGNSAIFFCKVSSSYTYVDQNMVWNASKNFTNLYGLSVRVGSGNTVATAEDYALDDDVTSTISNFAFSANSAGTDGKTVLTITISGTNATGADITISEIGITRRVITSNNNQALYDKEVMLVREVLNSPLTVEDGKGFSYTFKWEEK